MDRPILYHHSFADAKEWGEIDRWRESYRENCNCARAVEAAIKKGFDGMYLDAGCDETQDCVIFMS